MWPRCQLPPCHMPHATQRTTACPLPCPCLPPPCCLLLAYAADCASTVALQIFAAGIIKFTFRWSRKRSGTLKVAPSWGHFQRRPLHDVTCRCEGGRRGLAVALIASQIRSHTCTCRHIRLCCSFPLRCSCNLLQFALLLSYFFSIFTLYFPLSLSSSFSSPFHFPKGLLSSSFESGINL